MQPPTFLRRCFFLQAHLNTADPSDRAGRGLKADPTSVCPDNERAPRSLDDCYLKRAISI